MIFKDGLTINAPTVLGERYVGISTDGTNTTVLRNVDGSTFELRHNLNSAITAVEFTEVVSVAGNVTVYKSAYVPS